MNATRPDVVSGRKSPGVPLWAANILENTTSMNTGVNSVIFISGARIHDRKPVTATAETRSEIHGSRLSTNVVD